MMQTYLPETEELFSLHSRSKPHYALLRFMLSNEQSLTNDYDEISESQNHRESLIHKPISHTIEAGLTIINDNPLHTQNISNTKHSNELREKLDSSSTDKATIDQTPTVNIKKLAS
jgi:hypothetical protein